MQNTLKETMKGTTIMRAFNMQQLMKHLAKSNVILAFKLCPTKSAHLASIKA